MSMIDFTQAVTADDKAAEAQEQRVNAIKAECRKRILSVADETAQMNMTAAASSGRMTDDQKAAWGSALQWVDDMRKACVAAIGDGKGDFTSDKAWPKLPAQVAALVAAY